MDWISITSTWNKFKNNTLEKFEETIKYTSDQLKKLPEQINEVNLLTTSLELDSTQNDTIEKKSIQNVNENAMKNEKNIETLHSTLKLSSDSLDQNNSTFTSGNLSLDFFSKLSSQDIFNVINQSSSIVKKKNF